MKLPEDAWQALEPHLAPLTEETVGRRHAASRVLSRELYATVDVPPFRVSAMDGYAVSGGEQTGSTLPVVATVQAGDPPGAQLEPANAVRIMTGAPVPRGADRVIPVELSDGGNDEVRFERDVETGDNIRQQGEVVREGERLLPAGTLLTPGGLALLATHGISRVPVIRAPRVAVLATGNEVVPPESVPQPGQLRDSHTDFFLAAVAALGCRVEALGIARDEPELLRRKIEKGLEADVLLLSGGVSMGEYDLVEAAFRELGLEVLFDAVAIQPGKPVVAARHAGGFVFGLPGNPASAMVTFWLFVRPTLRRLLGLHDRFWYGALAAELEVPLPGAKRRDRFLPVEIRFEQSGVLARPLTPKGSHDVDAYAYGTGLVRIPAGATTTPAGGRCEILPLVDWRVPAADSGT